MSTMSFIRSARTGPALIERIPNSNIKRDLISVLFQRNSPAQLEGPNYVKQPAEPALPVVGLGNAAVFRHDQEVGDLLALDRIVEFDIARTDYSAYFDLHHIESPG